jgi:aconitate hydratase
VPCTITYADGTQKTIQIKCRIDTEIEIEYVEHGGVLHYVLRDLAASVLAPASAFSSSGTKRVS